MDHPHGARAALEPLRFRQVHLDFHTSEMVPQVGGRFRKDQFQNMLRAGHVDSITCFSKCHHGWSYHPTNVGAAHPHLAGNLLAWQIDACREIEVNVPIYISAGWDEKAAREHPDWLRLHRDGATYDPLRAGWKDLCFNSPYLDYLCAQIEEVVDRFDADGIFLDIVWNRPCYCARCMAGMQREGFNPEVPADAVAFADTVLSAYYERTTAACRKNVPNLRVFHNNGQVYRGQTQWLPFYSHLELESLPTGGWGYDHFPLAARYAPSTGLDYLGMTGKFHRSWGEFGGFKRADALRYECGAMLAFGAKCSIGDQMHPSGEMNPDTYALVGAAYAEVEAKEPWCAGARSVANVAILSVSAWRAATRQPEEAASPADEGAARMLLEGHVPFDVVDARSPLTGYRLLILPDEITPDAALADTLCAFVQSGGTVLLSGASGMDPTLSRFVVDAGLEPLGASEWLPDYVVAGPELPSPPARGPLVVYGGAMDVALCGARPLATRLRPYFNRRYDHFCGHQHAPDAEPLEYPAAAIHGGVAYFAHRIFTAYRRYGQPLYRDMVMDAIRLLIGAPLVETSLPASGRVSVMRQDAERRHIVHLLHATPALRGGAGDGEGQRVEVIEDLVPLYDVTVSLALEHAVRAVRLAPEGTALPYEQAGGRVRFMVPRVHGHQMTEITWE